MDGGPPAYLSRRRVVEVLRKAVRLIEAFHLAPNIYAADADQGHPRELLKGEFVNVPNDYESLDGQTLAGLVKLIVATVADPAGLPGRALFTESQVSALKIAYMLRASENNTHIFSHGIFNQLGAEDRQLMEVLFDHFDVLIERLQDYSVFQAFGPLVFQQVKKTGQNIGPGCLLEMLYGDLRKDTGAAGECGLLQPASDGAAEAYESTCESET